MFRYLNIALVIAFLSHNHAVAGPVTYSGTQLLTLPGARTPNSAPELLGSAIRFTEFGSSVVYSLPLTGLLNSFDYISLSLNLTQSSGRYAPHVYLSNGDFAHGGALATSGVNPANDGYYINPGAHFINDGSVVNSDVSAFFLSGNPGLPGAGNTFDLKLDFTVGGTGTQINFDAGGTPASYFDSRPLNLANGLFLFISSGIQFENQIQINSITFENALDPTAIAEPQMTTLLALMLVGLFLVRWRSTHF